MFGDTRDFNNIDTCDPGACGFANDEKPASPAPGGGTLLRWANAGVYWDWHDERGGQGDFVWLQLREKPGETRKQGDPLSL
jgi:hypothetical protein